MFWRMAADALVVIHLGFILFVMLGGLLLLRWPSLIWLHVPAVAWGVIVECLHLGCPLTPWKTSCVVWPGRPATRAASSSII